MNYMLKFEGEEKLAQIYLLSTLYVNADLKKILISIMSLLFPLSLVETVHRLFKCQNTGRLFIKL